MQRQQSQPRVRKKCNFCKAKINEIDYKDVATLSRYLDRWSKIESKQRNGNCSRHQRWLTLAIKRARHLALLPFTIR